MKKSLFTFLLFILILTGYSQTKPDTLTYIRQEAMIPMRDGIRLFTVIYKPQNIKEDVPFLMGRTPYSVSWMPSPNNIEYIANLARDGYIFVFQDIRGQNKSEGKFEMLRPARDKSKPNTIDESTDTYDAIEWLIKNIKGNNGKAGILGISYDGWTTMMGTIEPHPALKAVSEQATPSDMFIGDDLHHNGAFRLSYGFEYVYMVENAKENSQYQFDNYDTFEWYYKLGKLSNVNKNYFHGKLPSWNDFVSHPNYDNFWQKQSLSNRLDTPTVHNLHVAGWWDQEDFYGPLKAYETLEKKDKQNKNFIVIGPWNHGGWAFGKGSELGRIKFGVSTSEYFRAEIQAKWFAYYLKGVGDGKFAEALTFQTGSNTWQNYDQWPPLKITQTKNLYINANGKLSFNPPTGKNEFDFYISDPANPVPYRSRPIEATYGPGSRWYTWLVEDQRFVHRRPDVLSWESDALAEDLTVTGNLLANLFASTSGSDCDWIVKLIDVYPDIYPDETKMAGYQLMIANDVFRARFHKSFEKPDPIKPDVVNKYSIDLHAVNHVFKKGHKIMVQIQSTWFPLIDRNPQKYIPNIFEAQESDFQKATQNIYRSS